MNRGEALANIQRSMIFGLGPIGCIPCLAESLLVFGRWTTTMGGRLCLPLGTRHFQWRCAICTRLPQVSAKTAVVTGPITTGG